MDSTEAPSPSPAPIDQDENNNSSSSSSSPSPRPASPDIPLTMTASLLLADLPRNAAAALASASPSSDNKDKDSKVRVRFKPVGAAPALQQELSKISASAKFEVVVRYLRKRLRCKDTDSVFLYVNSAFAPSLDEIVGNLHQCFKDGQGQLVIAYSITPAFG